MVRRVPKTQTRLPNAIQVDSQGNMHAGNAEAVSETATGKYSTSKLQGMEVGELMSLTKSLGLIDSEGFKATVAKLILSSQEA